MHERYEKFKKSFMSSHPSSMSDTKWLKLFSLFNSFESEFPNLKGPIYYALINHHSLGPDAVVNPWPTSLPRKDDIDIHEGKPYILDGHSLGMGGPIFFSDIWEIAIPIVQKEVTIHQLTGASSKETILFPNYSTFLSQLDQQAKFPYRITEEFTKKYFKKSITKGSNEQFIYWKFIVFYGYVAFENSIFQ